MPKIKRKENTCTRCGKTKAANGTNFYKSLSPAHVSTGFSPVCKQCVHELYNGFVLKGMTPKDATKEICKILDKAYIEEIFEVTYPKYGKDKGFLGVFFKNCSMQQYIKQGIITFADSIFIDDKKQEEDNLKQKNDYGTVPENLDELISLKEKYGYGYPNDEYVLFEKKFIQLKPSFQLLTTMHEECLKEYCVDKVKETLAKSRGDFKEAKEWANMAKDAAEAGKLKPSQMSKADLSSGLDTFGQLVRMVEQTDEGELLGLFPKFIEQPKDKVDIVLWHYTNYVRDLKGLPECEYKDIYAFYEKRNEEYEKQMLDIQLSPNKKGDSDG